MQSEVLEIENFFNIFQQKTIIQFLNSNALGWRYQEKPSIGQEDYYQQFTNNEIVKDSPVMSHVFFPSANSYQTNLYDMFYPKLCTLFQKQIIIHRIQANIGLPCPNYSAEYMPPHIDWIYDKHMTLVYYVNTCDGNTFIFNEKYPNIQHENKVSEVKLKVVPKQGKACIFDGFSYHAGSPSKNQLRKVINVNFFI